MTQQASEEQHDRLEAVRDAVDDGAMQTIRRMTSSLHPAEIAQLLESLPPTERKIVWDLTHPDDEGEILVHLNDEVRAGMLAAMDDDAIVAATDGMELDDLADLIVDLPEAITRRIVVSMDQQDRERLSEVLAYDEDTAGGLMNPDVVAVRPDVTVEVVIRYLRRLDDLPRRTETLFVVDRYGRYLGSLFVTRLLTHDDHTLVSELMESDVEGIHCNLPEAEVAKLFENRDLLSAAVVDDEGRLVGRITVDDIVDVIRDEAEHSIMSMAGLDEEDDMFAPVVASARRRAVWLGVNLATAFVAAWVVGLFEATIAEVVALAVLMPVVASMGGIAGSQTLTLIIRGLALGQVTGANAGWLLTREIFVSAWNGLVWAAVVAGVAVWWFDSWQLGAVIAAAIVINLFAGAAAGVGIPLALKRMNIDPALAGSVVLTTITDVVGFMSFLGLGALFLR